MYRDNAVDKILREKKHNFGDRGCFFVFFFLNGQYTGRALFISRGDSLSQYNHKNQTRGARRYAALLFRWLNGALPLDRSGGESKRDSLLHYYFCSHVLHSLYSSSAVAVCVLFVSGCSVCIGLWWLSFKKSFQRKIACGSVFTHIVYTNYYMLT